MRLIAGCRPSAQSLNSRDFDGEHVYDVILTDDAVVLGRPGVVIGCEAFHGHVVDEMGFRIDAEPDSLVLLGIVDGGV